MAAGRNRRLAVVSRTNALVSETLPTSNQLVPSVVYCQTPSKGVGLSFIAIAANVSPSGSEKVESKRLNTVSPGGFVVSSLIPASDAAAIDGASLTGAILVARKTSLSLIAVEPPLTEASISSRVAPLVVAPV